MAKSREELLAEIAGATPTGGGNNLRDGRYRLAVRKTALESGFKGARWGMDFVVAACSKMPGLVELKTGRPIDIEPNAVGTDVGIVKMLTTDKSYQAPGLGDAKSFVLALFGIPMSDATPADLLSMLDELDKSNSGYGMVIDCVTRRKVSGENEVEMVLQDWHHVPGQTAEHILATRKWIESITAAPAAPAVPAAQTTPVGFGPPTAPPTAPPQVFGPPKA